MTARELLFEAVRAMQHQSFTTQEIATFTCLPDDVVGNILESWPWEIIGRAMPPHSQYWMPGHIEISPDRKSDEREIAEWNALFALGRLTR